MDRWQAQYNFWSSFGYPAYDANSVPDGDNKPSFPYITYQGVDGTFDTDISVTASVWTRGYSWSQADSITNAIYTALKNGGVTVRYNDGLIWVTLAQGYPFAQNMGDPDDDLIRRKVLSVVLHFI